MKRKILVLSVLLVLTLVTAGGALARMAGYALPWWTVDSGGGASTGGGYQLSGTIGQPDAGALTSGNYRLEGGFWDGAPSAPQPSLQLLYLPAVRK